MTTIAFSHKHQGIPEHGYTDMIEKILDHDRITVNLQAEFKKENSVGFEYIFYSGPLDGWFGYDFGRLGYRPLDFERSTYDGGYQGRVVMNYGDKDVPFIRITKHKHFFPWSNYEGSVLYREFSSTSAQDDIPYYPIRLVEEKEILDAYVAKAQKERSVTFVGRLGTYRYLDMDVTIREALDTEKVFLDCLETRTLPPAFVHSA